MINKQVFRLKKNGEPCWNCLCQHPELIENYDKAISDKMQTWDCHHRREDTYSCKELIERGEYFDVKPEELIFLTREEHNKVDSRCKRVSEGQKGRSAWNKGKTLSEEYKKKLSEAKKGKHWKLVEGKRCYY